MVLIKRKCTSVLFCFRALILEEFVTSAIIILISLKDLIKKLFNLNLLPYFNSRYVFRNHYQKISCFGSKDNAKLGKFKINCHMLMQLKNNHKINFLRFFLKIVFFLTPFRGENLKNTFLATVQVLRSIVTSIFKILCSESCAVLWLLLNLDYFLCIQI